MNTAIKNHTKFVVATKAIMLAERAGVKVKYKMLLNYRHQDLQFWSLLANCLPRSLRKFEIYFDSSLPAEEDHIHEGLCT